MTPLQRRLAALEGRSGSTEAKPPMLVIAQPGETLDEAMARVPSACIALPCNGRGDA